MAIYTEQEAKEFSFPNIKVYRILKDGELSRYEARPNAGYVMLNLSEKNFDFDPDTFEQKEVTKYRTVAGFPKNYNFAKFPYKTELRILVDPKYIF